MCKGGKEGGGDDEGHGKDGRWRGGVMLLVGSWVRGDDSVRTTSYCLSLFF